MDMCIECNRIVTGKQEALVCDYCNQWQHRIYETRLTLKKYRTAVHNGGLDWVCGPCLSQENEQPANNHDEVIYIISRKANNNMYRVLVII